MELAGDYIKSLLSTTTVVLQDQYLPLFYLVPIPDTEYAVFYPMCMPVSTYRN
jgi:hypothetical protein